MKKLIFFFLSFCMLGMIFHSCNNTKTYAELLADERKAISKFIEDNKITVISESDFLKDTLTDVSKNEYVYFDNGLYMQIVNRGSKELKDTFQNNDIVLTRYLEYDILNKDTLFDITDTDKFVYINGTSVTASYPEAFRLVKTETSISGLFLFNEPGTYPMLNMYHTYWHSNAVTGVMNGWLMSLQYVSDGAHVRLIVPSKIGHNYAMQAVIPYYYDIVKYQRY